METLVIIVSGNGFANVGDLVFESKTITLCIDYAKRGSIRGQGHPNDLDSWLIYYRKVLAEFGDCRRVTAIMNPR